MHKYLYKGYIETIAQRFEAALDEIEAIYNFDLGDEFELAICKVLRVALPQKYGICRGHVVNADDQTAGDDIIIYDATRFPTLRVKDAEDGSKQWIPIEAVYAYIEAKHTLTLTGTEKDNASLQKSVKQAAAVKAICLSRPALSPFQVTPFLSLENLMKIDRGPGVPPVDNPVFTMIMSRYVRREPGAKRLETSASVHDGLLEQGRTIEVDNRPDVLVLGKDIIALPVILSSDGATSRLSTPFFVPSSSSTKVIPVPGISVGIGLALLLFALDYIRLGRMPWEQIIINSFNPRTGH